MEEQKSEESEEHTHVKHHEHVSKKPKDNTWQIVSGVLGVLLLISLIYNAGILGNKGSEVVSGSLSAADAKQNTIDYITSNLVPEGTEVSAGDVTDVNGLYNIKLMISGKEFDSYVSKDGKLLFPSFVDMTQKVEKPSAEQPVTPTEVPKTDKPAVELFVMSHCPYGTQTEKGMLPVVKQLKDKADFEIKFVYYSMHGEVEVREQTAQYCIQKEQNSKYFDYLGCFLKEGDSETCLAETDIDTDKLDSCVEATNKEFDIDKNLEDTASYLSGRFPKFDINKADNEKYGVGGSPTLVINGQEISSARDSASLLRTVCAAFTTPPAECSETLSSDAPSAGFGYNTAGDAAAAAACGVV